MSCQSLYKGQIHCQVGYAGNSDVHEIDAEGKVVHVHANFTWTDEGNTKWSVLTGRVAALREQADAIERELDVMKRTTFDMPCSGCGWVMVTEADFAQHFTLNNIAYLNLGACPVAAAKRASS